MMLSVMAFEQNQEISCNHHKESLLHFISESLNIIYLIYVIVDFMHAQNGDMSLLPSLHMQLRKIKGPH